MNEIALMTVTGVDGPGITTRLTAILARYGGVVLDIGQSTIHNVLTLGMLVELPAQGGAETVRDLLFEAHAIGLDIRFRPIAEKNYEHWVGEQGQQRHILTLLGREIGAAQIAAVTEVISRWELNIDHIVRLAGRISRSAARPHAPACIELSVRGAVADLSALHAELLALARDMAVDIAVQKDDIFRRHRRLFCFDMDSTLIQTEVIDELARAAGVGERVAAITEAAMRGELDFRASFRQRLALLAGLDEAVLAEIAARLPITEGAERLMATLKRLGYRIAILSGGFSYFAEVLQRRFGIDYVHANQLECRDGRLTGAVSGPIVDGARKAELLRELAAREGISLEQVVAVGDGANDLPMLAIAGLGVAFHAKPIVTEQARHSLANVGLDGILYLLGMRERDISALAPLPSPVAASLQD